MQVVDDFKMQTTLSNTDLSDNHHEDRASFQQKTNAHIMSLVNTFKDYSNPFEESEKYELFSLKTRKVVSPKKVEKLRNLENEAVKQYEKFVKSIIIKISDDDDAGKKSIWDHIKRNEVAIFEDESSTPASTS